MIQRFTGMTSTFQFDADTGNANRITSLNADGFSVGSDNTANKNGTIFYYVAFNDVSGIVDANSYTGNGTDNRNITGVGFQPEYVMVRANDMATARQGQHRPASLDRHELALLQRFSQQHERHPGAPVRRLPGGDRHLGQREQPDLPLRRLQEHTLGEPPVSAQGPGRAVRRSPLLASGGCRKPAADLAGLTLHSRGKVRDVYDLGDRLLIVATDRICAFDSILPTAIPDKGKVLTELCVFWFKRIADIVANHLISTDVPDEARGRGAARRASSHLAGRVRRARLPRRLGLEGVPARRDRLRHRAAAGSAGGRPAARADLHPRDQG